MRKALFPVVLFLFAIILAFAGPDDINPQAFKQYWYQGKAELSRYELKQARYGEIHKGESVLVFVTEPFLTDKQVKYDHGDKSKSVSVLKLNFTRRFYTGIYPYTLITSIFTPVDFQKMRTLKVASTTQEWCGITFMQLNYRNNQYSAQIRSYFQSEGDQDLTVKTNWLEDELWTRIRLAPSTLPSGDLDLVPGLQYVRLWHAEVKPERATATLTSEGAVQVYTIDYKSIKRKLVIKYEKKFPYSITAWEETQPGGFDDSELLTTRAVRTNTLLLDYWNRHNLKDDEYRKQLGLTQ